MAPLLLRSHFRMKGALLYVINKNLIEFIPTSCIHLYVTFNVHKGLTPTLWKIGFLSI